MSQEDISKENDMTILEKMQIFVYEKKDIP